VVSGGTVGGVQQQQGNASRASIAGRYSIPISPLVNNILTNYWTIKIWCVLMRKRKEGKERLNDGKIEMED